MLISESAQSLVWSGCSLNILEADRQMSQIDRLLTSGEILMFVSKKMPNNAVMIQSLIILIRWSTTSTVSTKELYIITALFDICLDTNIKISPDLGNLLTENSSHSPDI